MDPDADRHPGSAGIGVTGRPEQLQPRFDRLAGVLAIREAGDEQGGDLIADQLIDECVPADQHVDRGFVEPVHQPAELERRHPFGDGRRAAHVDEEHGQLDLRAARVGGGEAVAGAAEARVLIRPVDALDSVDEGAADAGKRPEALDAARVGGQPGVDAAVALCADVAFGEDGAPDFIIRFGWRGLKRHRFIDFRERLTTLPAEGRPFLRCAQDRPCGGQADVVITKDKFILMLQVETTKVVTTKYR